MAYHVSTLSRVAPSAQPLQKIVPPIQSTQPAASSAAASNEDIFTVRIPKDKRRKFTMMKFGTAANLDFAKLGDTSVKMERENNLREYKTANDLDTMPKFGAGSEYGRDQKEESRRKKYGIMLKKYNPDDQPWHLKIGSGKQAKRYKGVREGTISENTSYYIFTKAADGAFEAFPVEEWYNFSPIIKYKYLNSDEAEEEFSRRDKTLNLFSIMLKKRYKKDEDIGDDDDDDEGRKKGPKKSKKKANKDLVLTDMDDWDDLRLSDDEDDDDFDNDEDNESAATKKKKKGKGVAKRKVKNAKQNSDDEAVEESDEGDFDDREVDYMSDSGDTDSSLSGTEAERKEKALDEKGVDQEAGLRNILDSDAEEEEEEKEEMEEEEEDAEKEEPEGDSEKKEKKKGDDSSSSSSEDDSDIEKDAKLASAIFMQPQQNKQSGDAAAPSTSGANLDGASPSPDKLKGLKRKPEKSADGKSPSSKKHKSDGSEGITEDAIRRYLMRKPMTTKDLLTKFKAKKLNMTKERMTHVIAQLLKKINPEKQTINKLLYLSLKKPE